MVSEVRFLRHLCVALALSLGFEIATVSAEEAPCVSVSEIAKWEILDSDDTITYSSDGTPIAFIGFVTSDIHDLRKGSPSFRFFSPTICAGDNVQINEELLSVVVYVNWVRK